MKICIEMEVDLDFQDPDHDTGLTEEGYLEITKALSPFAFDFKFEKVE